MNFRFGFWNWNSKITQNCTFRYPHTYFIISVRLCLLLFKVPSLRDRVLGVSHPSIFLPFPHSSDMLKMTLKSRGALTTPEGIKISVHVAHKICSFPTPYINYSSHPLYACRNIVSQQVVAIFFVNFIWRHTFPCWYRYCVLYIFYIYNVCVPHIDC